MEQIRRKKPNDTVEKVTKSESELGEERELFKENFQMLCQGDVRIFL